MTGPEAVAAAILLAVRQRGPDRTLCPSEVARSLDPAGWRALMPAVRAVAAELAAEGAICVTQRGRPVDANDARGPIRLGQARSSSRDRRP